MLYTLLINYALCITVCFWWIYANFNVVLRNNNSSVYILRISNIMCNVILIGVEYDVFVRNVSYNDQLNLKKKIKA